MVLMGAVRSPSPPYNPGVRIGIHVRGFDAGRPVAVEKALERRAEVIQIFASSPRMWKTVAVVPSADRELRLEMREHDVKPLFIHAPYLVNLASPSAATRDLSLKMLAWNLERAEALGAAGVVVHAGAAVSQAHSMGLKHVARGVVNVLGRGSRGPRVLVELTAGGAGAVASNFTQAQQLLDACGGHSRLGFCVDTCHLHAAGYELSSSQGVAEMVDEIRGMVGIGRLRLIHANDSRDPRGSRRDRHWHVGRGYIGRKGFQAIVTHPRLRNVPVVCETPGEVRDDRRNIALLKRLRGPP